MAEVVEITDENFEEKIAGSEGAALVDFWAPWCGPCRMMHPIIEKLAEEFEGRAIIARCNVDENPSLAARFGITAIPTLIIFKNGQSSDMLIGVTSLDSLKERIEANL